MPAFERIELDQHRAVRRMKILNAFKGFCFEKTQQFSDALVSFEGDLPAEVNEQRLIAGALELRKGGRGEHGGKSIPPEACRECGPLAGRELQNKSPAFLGGGEAGLSIASYFTFVV